MTSMLYGPSISYVSFSLPQIMILVVPEVFPYFSSPPTEKMNVLTPLFVSAILKFRAVVSPDLELVPLLKSSAVAN